MNKFAINGGEKAIKYDQPHWKWPPVSNEEIDALIDYMNKMEYNNKGYPTVVESLEKEFSKNYNNICC